MIALGRGSAVAGAGLVAAVGCPVRGARHSEVPSVVAHWLDRV